MAMDLLRRIAASPLPASFRSPEDIDMLRVLHAAGLVRAVFSAETPSSRPTEAPGAVVVAAITAKGLEELRTTGEPDAQLRRSAATLDVVKRLRSLVERSRGAPK